MATQAADFAEDAGQVELIQTSLHLLTEQGILMRVAEDGFGALREHATWREMGVKLPNGAERLFGLPSFGVLPDRYRKPLVQCTKRARRILDARGEKFSVVELLTGSTQYRWISLQAYALFCEERTALYQELAAAKMVVLENYSDIQREMRGIFEALLRDSARRLAATAATAAAEDAGEEEGPGLSEVEIAAVVRRCMEAMPTPDEIRALRVAFVPRALQFGAEWMGQAAADREARNRLDAATSAARVRDQVERISVDSARSMAEAATRREWIKTHATEEQARKDAELAAQMRAERLDATRRLLAQTLDPIMEHAQNLHGYVYGEVKQLHDTLLRRGTWHGSSGRSVGTIIQTFRALNWAGNEDDLGKLIDQLEALSVSTEELRAAKLDRDVDGLKETLAKIVDHTADNARALRERGVAARMVHLEI
jgi:hypothetical protein